MARKLSWCCSRPRPGLRRRRGRHRPHTFEDEDAAADVIAAVLSDEAVVVEGVDDAFLTLLVKRRTGRIVRV